MGLVAVVAVGLATCLGLVERSKRLLNLAKYHEIQMQYSQSPFHPIRPFWEPGGGLPGPDVTGDNPEWHATMAYNYRWAARYPFLPVPATPSPTSFMLAECVKWRMLRFEESALAAERVCLCAPTPPAAVLAPSGGVSPTVRPVDGLRLSPAGP